MFNTRRLLPAFVTALLVLCFAPSVGAQTDGTLTPGQPSIGEITSPGAVLTYDYTLADARGVTLQAIGDTIQPRIRVLRDGVVVAEQLNPEGASIVTLTTVLKASAYQVEVGGVNESQGLVVLLVQAETPVEAIPLVAGAPISSEVSEDTPVALFSVWDGLAAPAFLYIESLLPDSSPRVRVINTATGQTSASLDADILGVRLRLPAASVAYQIEISHNGGETAEPFTLCLSAVGTNSCDSAIADTILMPELTPTTFVSVDCTVASAFSGGTNIRQSANLNAVIVGVLPINGSAQVLGISPDGAFYNVLYNGVVGWTAISALTTSGDCSAVPVVNPPAMTLAPTLSPTPTQPPQPTAIPPSPTPSGPCLITMTAQALVYSQPTAQADYIQDQVQAGYDLIPVGRLADNSWWRTNYMSAWIQTSLFGNGATVSGDCSTLPVLVP